MDVDGQRFLLGVTEQSVTVLNTSETPAEQPRELTAVAPAPARVAGVSATSPNGGAAFARVLSQLQSEPVAHSNPAPVAYLPEARSSSVVGSILSPITGWRAAAALRRARSPRRRRGASARTLPSGCWRSPAAPW